MRKIAPAFVTVLLAASAPPAIAQPEPAARLTLCRPGPQALGADPDTQALSTATCPYDETDLAGRIAHLIERALGTRIEHVGLALSFGLPGIKPIRSERRMTAYATMASGKDWNMLIAVREAAFPLGDDQPAVFETGADPRRLVELDKLDVEIDLTLEISNGATGPDGCLTAARLAAAAKSAEWQDLTTLSQTFVTDGGPGYPLYRGPEGRIMTFTLDRQEGGVPTAKDMETSCLRKVMIATGANTPEGLKRRTLPVP
jgi:hypothetical protein